MGIGMPTHDDADHRTPAQREQEERITELQQEIYNLRTRDFGQMIYGAGVSDEQLGALLREYIVESEHSSWEGFSFEDLSGIGKLFGDIALYYEHSQEDRNG